MLQCVFSDVLFPVDYPTLKYALAVKGIPSLIAPVLVPRSLRLSSIDGL
jgi:hypothetical protein